MKRVVRILGISIALVAACNGDRAPTKQTQTQAAPPAPAPPPQTPPAPGPRVRRAPRPARTAVPKGPRPAVIAIPPRIPPPYKATPLETSTCGTHGYYGDEKPCCPGLSKLVGKLEHDGSCAPITTNASQGSICAPCGDGVCHVSEDRCNCPADCAPTAARPTIKYDGHDVKEPPRRPPSIMYYPEDGDNPETKRLAALLLKVWQTGDIKRCDALPKVGKDVIEKLERADRFAYCRALAQDDPAGCQQVSRGFDLHCESFFRQVAIARDNSVAGCLELLEITTRHSGDVRDCLRAHLNASFGPYRLRSEVEVADSPGEFTPAVLDLMDCFDQTFGDKYFQCLSDAAAALDHPRICEMMEYARKDRCLTQFR